MSIAWYPPTFFKSKIIRADIKEKLKVNVKIKGNLAEGQADAEAFGSNTFTDAYANTFAAEGLGSTSQAFSVSAAGRDKFYHFGADFG